MRITERIAAAVVIGVLIGLLVIATGAAKQAAVTADFALEQMRVDLDIIRGKDLQLSDLRARLSEMPPPVVITKTVVEPCRVTPIFARDSQVYAGR